jgi:hypothetical protein
MNVIGSSLTVGMLIAVGAGCAATTAPTLGAEGDPCTVSSDCGQGEYCGSGTCKLRTWESGGGGGGGASCITDADCSAPCICSTGHQCCGTS